MDDGMRNPLDNPFVQILSRIGDLILVNMLFILCSIPVITAGAAAAALHKVAQSIVMDTEVGVFMPFFRAFKENFKQATVLWLGELVILGALVSYRLIFDGFLPQGVASVLNILLLVVGLLLLCVAVYALPLLVRYENSLSQLLKNAAILSVIKLPRTLAMVGLALIMPVTFYLSVTVFIDTLFFWMIIGFGFVAYLDSKLLKPVFLELERVKEGHGSIGIMN